jgi:hypothetical protein
MKTKMMEAKFSEEKLKLQQKHDAEVQKVGMCHICCVQCHCTLGLGTGHTSISPSTHGLGI